MKKSVQVRGSIQGAVRPPEYEALTVQALRMLTEVFRGAGMSQDVFAREYLNGIGDYERRVARKHHIKLPRSFWKRSNNHYPTAGSDNKETR